MNTSLLEELGMRVRQGSSGLEAELTLSNALVNPLTKREISQVVFTGLEDRLIVVDPPELVGVPPMSLSRLERAQDVEDALTASYNDHLFHVQRRSAELTALGLSPRVDPDSLVLTAEVIAGNLNFLIATDKRGNFRIVQALRGSQELQVSGVQPFELSEFRERGALVGYLQALFAEPHEAAAAPIHDRLVGFGEVVSRFGAEAILPPKSSLEILIELSVDGARYRFAAARVVGRSFRGLLAGSAGKVWAERFELEQFPGVEKLVSDLLNVPLERVRVLGPSEVV